MKKSILFYSLIVALLFFVGICITGCSKKESESTSAPTSASLGPIFTVLVNKR